MKYNEILQFFAEYQPNTKSVIIGKTASGKMNGLGALLFAREEDAKTAMLEK